MFIEESFWIKEKLSGLDISPGSRILNIGASDSEFLATQPHIEENVLRPLSARGCLIINLDLKKSRDSDRTGDITDKALPAKLGERYRLVMCTNLLEHVADRNTAFSNIAALVEPGGYLLLTVPNNYPPHQDPIDTLYRPSAAELADEITRHRAAHVLFKEVLEIKNHRYYYYRSRLPLWGYRKFIFWRLWLAKYRWKVACVLCRISDV